MDYDNLGSAPDIDSIDESALDFGNAPAAEPKAPAAAEPSQEELQKELDEANGKAAKEAEKNESSEKEEKSEEEPPRDEKGRFTEKEARIPKSRFDEAVGKEREAREAAERRAAELERRLQETASQKEQAQQTEQLEAEIDKLEEKYQELLLDGNTKEASQVMRQIRHMERQIATAEAEARATQRTAQTLEAERLEVSIARLEADYPEFNAESESYDPDLVSLVLAKQKALISNGVSPSKAMAQAGEEVAKRFIAREEAKDDAKGLAKATQNDRQKQAVEKALAAQKSQPASMKDAGLDSDARGEKGLPDVSSMTADEFDALPEATKARLLGNVI